MQFLKEIWFILLNVPALYHRYETKAIWAGVFFLLSAATFIVERLFPTQVRLLVWARRVSLGLTSLLFLLALIDLAKSRLPFDELVCSEVAVDAYYHLAGDKVYELVQRQRCVNRTGHPIRNLPDLRDGYYEQIPDWRCDAGVVQGPPGVKLVFVNAGQEQRTDYIGNSPIYLYWRRVEFHPPLPSEATVDFVHRISARGTAIEARAFSGQTVFYRGVDFDTLRYDIMIHGPAGCQFDLVDWGVIDSGGHRDSGETERQDEPHIVGSGGVLEWRVALARKHLRYMLKFGIRRYAWDK